MFGPSWFVMALQLTCAHCSHLDIYISQKTRPCVVDLEGQFQTSLEAKLSNFLIQKLRSIILIFLLFFAGIVKFSAFCTLLLLFQRVEASKLQFDAKTCFTNQKQFHKLVYLLQIIICIVSQSFNLNMCESSWNTLHTHLLILLVFSIELLSMDFSS